MTKTLFLPGAGGSASFWRAAADSTKLDGVFLAWPGLGDEPPADEVNSLNDLVSIVLQHMKQPVHIVAQSVGGLVAMKAALAAPGKVQRLVLAATSSGVPVKDLGGRDWGPEYYQEYPNAAAWIGEIREDLSEDLKTFMIPTLLLWGDCDPISPLAVGERLLSLLPNAQLHLVRGAGHDLARARAQTVGSLIEEFLTMDGMVDGDLPARRAT
jgi:pimeloyl-ACP methyl ester carboxylesterase